MQLPPLRRHSWVFAILAGAGCALLGAAQAAQPNGATSSHTPGGAMITPNFKEADINQVIEAVELATGKTFIVDPRVKGNVTLLSQTPMTPDQFYQAFLSILQVYGFVAVPSGKIIKIIPDTNMNRMPGNDLPEAVSGSSDEVVTQVIAVKNVQASQLPAILRPLMPTTATISVVNGSNMLIISDRASNVRRIERIIERIDQTSNTDIEVIKLINANASDTLKTLTALVPAAATDASGTPLKVVADERSNSILISGDPAARLRIRTLIATLDTPIEGGGETRVRYLRYAAAEDMAAKLKGQGSSSSSSAARPATSSGLGSSSTGSGSSSPFGSVSTTTSSNNFSVNGSSNSGSSYSSSGGGAGTVNIAGGQATIWADKETNALIITANARVMKALDEIIDKLDIRRAQVLVEAIIAEVDVDKTSDLGVNWIVSGGANAPAVGGFVNPIGGTSIVDLYNSYLGVSSGTATTTTGGITAPLGATIGIGNLSSTGVSFGAILRALQGDARTNIIGTPSVVTQNNQEAKMEVGQEVPFVTGQYTSTVGTSSAFQTVQREEVGTILDVTPQINQGDAVLLKIDLESSSLSTSAGDAGSLITNKRTISTSVLIRDGGTLVLGGLIQDSTTNTQNSVPLLGKIPIIGELFHVRNTSKTKTDFLIFLQPHILRDDRAAAIETDAKYNYVREEQRRLNKDQDAHLPLLPFQPADVLPDIHNGATQGGILGAGDIGNPGLPQDNTTKAGPEGSAGAAVTPLAPSPPAPSTSPDVTTAPAPAPTATDSAPGATQ
ncbi:MAG: type II secretion system secretin GspD [Steroidobacteraceae bacterium]